MNKRDITVLDYLDNSVNVCPDKAAFIDENNEYTFTQIDELSDRIATFLINEKYGFNQPLAVLVDRSVRSVVLFMAVVKSHCFYVPIDSSLPVDRINVIIETINPKALLYTDEIEDGLGIPVFKYDDLINTDIDKDILKEVRNTIISDDPLLAICTSGSTGIPKGVVKSHRTVLEFIPVFVKTFGFDENDVFGNQAPFDFDVSLKDIYTTLYLGATMFVIPRKYFTMPKLLMDAFDERKISVCVWAVSAVCVLAGVNAFKYKIPSFLKKVLFSGEIMPIKLLNIWRQYLPDVMYVNLYGPTEITGNILYYIVDREFNESERLPLGKEFSNTRVLILDDDNNPVNKGESGELCAITPCMAHGYYGNAEKTSQVFVQNPLNNNYPERMYRTGDVVEIRENGELYFVGRKDFQIKHMGHRIELEEIELNINSLEGVMRSCCLFDTDRNKIVAYYVGDKDTKGIIDDLNKKLPKYMIPSIFHKIDSMPLNKNGKIDRQKLREITS